MGTLSAIRSRKISVAETVTQITDGSTLTEVRLLKAQLKLAHIEDAKLRNHVKQLEDQVKQLEALPGELAALKDLVEKQECAAVKWSSLDDIARRLSVLEKPKPAVETAKLKQLDSDVQTLKTDMKTLGPLPEKLKQLQSAVMQHGTDIRTLDALPEKLKQLQTTVTQHGTDIVSALSRSKKLETEVGHLAGLKDDIKIIKEQRQAIKGDAIKVMIQTAMQSETKKMDAFRTENNKALKDVSTKVDAVQKICNDLNKRKLPEQLQNLQEKISLVESNDNKTYRKTMILEDNLTKLRDGSDTQSMTGRNTPIKTPHKVTKDSVLQRIEDLEDKSRSLRKEQDYLLGEQKKLSTKVDQLPVGTEVSQKQPSEYATISKQIKTFEDEQVRLSNEYNTIANQLKTYQSKQQNLFNQQKTAQAEQTKLCNEQKGFSQKLEDLSDRVMASENTIDQLKPLRSEQLKFSKEQEKTNQRVATLEMAPRTVFTSNAIVGNNDTDPARISSESQNIQQRLHLLESRINGETGLSSLSKIIDDLQDDFEKMDKEIHDYGRDFEMFQTNFLAIFKQTFDPFKVSIEQQLQSHSQTLTQHAETLTKLEEQVEKSHIETPTSGLTTEQLKLVDTVVEDTTTLKQALTRLQESFYAEVEHRNTTTQDLKQQLALKQDTLSAIQANDTVKAAVRNLQAQYDNISTDDLHQKMVQWFLQQYPSSSASLIQQFGAFQHEFKEMRNFIGQMSWVAHYAQTLGALARIGPQLQALVQSPSGSKTPSESLAKTMESLKTMETAIANVQKQNESLKDLEGNKIKEIFEHIEGLKAASTKLRTDHDEMVAKFITPNKDYLSLLRNLFVTASQMQYFVECLNQNLPKGPLEIDWHFDLNAEPSANPAPKSDKYVQATSGSIRKQ